MSTDPTASFTGSVPENYAAHLVPFLFTQYADDMVRRLPLAAGTRVLELACGTGVVTARIRDRLPAGSSFCATDLNQAMVDFARKSIGDRGITWQTADAQA